MSRAGSRAVAVLGLAALLSAVGVLAAHNLGYRGMWWDEAAQFWVSQGLSNYAPPFAGRRGLPDVLRMNRLENLDPGGFSVLLHASTALGRGLAPLRALPLAFFAIAAAALGLVGWRLTRSALFAVAASAVPALYPAVVYFALEVRAYSMEMAGLAIGALALVMVQEKPSVARASALGLVCAAFLTSRYSFVLVTLALGGALWVGAGRRAGRPTRVRLVASFLLPAAVAALGVWLVTFGHQLPKAMRGGPLGIAAPAYTREAVLRTSGDRLALVGRDLVSPAALPITVCAFVVLFARRRVYARLCSGRDDVEAQRSRTTYTTLYAFILGLQTLSAAVSAVGAYPWDIATRWSAYLLMLSALASVVLAAEARSLVLARVVATDRAGGPRRDLSRIGSALGAFVVAAACARLIVHVQTVEGPFRTNVALQLDRLPTTLAPHSVFVAFYEVPMVRYLYEYGPYEGRREYPTAFRFETLAEWQAKAAVRGADEGIGFVVSALPLAAAQARFPGLTVRPFGPPGVRLLTVRAPGGSAGPPAR